MKIGITGDTHGDLSFSQIHKARKAGITHLIVCGDFGYIWDGSIKEQRRLDYLNKMAIQVLFIDGNHENHKLLNEYPVSIMYRGRVHKIRDNIIHLIRGEVYELNGDKYFVFGGVNSTDIEYRKEGKTWWKEEKPTYEDKSNAYINLKKYKYEVDYVLTHTSYPLALTYVGGDTRIDDVSNHLDLIREKIKYKYWFFGHMHMDYNILDLDTRCIYKDIIEIDKLKK
ncbi:metallophosphoesterase family protein, partial [Romboutsia sp.]|uniref:metallophosphoesterase family protein n=1 Tax=Romboutsia sp. TaxID=1965302 RepID=UPI003F3D24B4